MSGCGAAEIRRTTMSLLHPLIGRRLLSSSTLVGAIGIFLPAIASRAGTARATPGGAGALSPAPAPSADGNTAVADTSVIDLAAAAQPGGDTPIRPFLFQASDEDLVDLKRRIAATRWPERETVSDATQGVNL